MSLLDPTAVATMIRKAQKSGKNVQFGALVYRIRNNQPQILLITSRGQQQWLIPKGWPMEGIKPHKAAAQEAWEEAGVRGRIFKQSLGMLRHTKDRNTPRATKTRIIVFPMEASKVASKFPEAKQRRRKWLSCKKAAARIANPELAKMVRDFDPRQIRRGKT